MRFNTKGPGGLVDGKSLGMPLRLNTGNIAALTRAVEDGSVPYIDGVVHWRLCDLVVWLHDEFDITLEETTGRSGLKGIGFRKS